jgi:hypothetical protein
MNHGFGGSAMLHRYLIFIAMLFLALPAPDVFASDMDVIRPDVATVRALYSDFAEEAIFEEPMSRKSVMGQPKGALTRFFTPELSALIVQENDCAARAREICNLDFSPIWDSQDPTGATVSIAKRSELGSVVVEIHYPDKEVRRLIYQLAKGATGWRIADISYSGDRPTLLQLLKHKH